MPPTINGFSTFNETILQFIRSFKNSVCNCYNPKGIKFITGLRLGLSHLQYHKFKHSFQDSIEEENNLIGILLNTFINICLESILKSNLKK